MMQSTIKFTKMHGLGNDFVIIDAFSQPISLEKIPIKIMSDRHQGIGFDQLLLIETSNIADFSCRIFNSDGSEAEQCGNGMRCLGLFIQQENLNIKKILSIETKAGLTQLDINDLSQIKVNMGIPKIQASTEIKLDHQTVNLFNVSMGNPHAILQVETIKNFPIQTLGLSISTHLSYPEGTNAGFMEIVNRGHIRLATFERGAGETLACGSNACAAVVAGIEQGLLDKNVTVELALGKLQIEWEGGNHSVVMSGPAEKVFEGCWHLTPLVCIY